MRDIMSWQLDQIWGKHRTRIETYFTHTIYPPRDEMFKAFEYFELRDMRACILGLDPYQNEGLAHGLAFSVQREAQKMPPSLRNIFKEIQRDMGGALRKDTDLSDWAVQGVLLLNTALSVEAGKSGSHVKLWEEFTQDLMRHIGSEAKHCVFMLWGNNALKYREYIDETRNMVLTHSHPSPLSRKPFTCGHFSVCNDYLETHGKSRIKWT